MFGKNTGAFEFENMCHRYGMTERPKFIYDKFAFPCLCTDLADENLHNDYRDFLDTFAPYIVAQWDDFEAEFSDRSIEVPVVLYHILKTARESGLPLKSVSEEQLCELYSSNRQLRHHLSMDAFIRCWKAIYCFSMPKLNVSTSKHLVDVVRLYRKHKSSRMDSASPKLGGFLHRSLRSVSTYRFISHPHVKTRKTAHC